ncbi:MAG: transposase [Chloroflexi bacterium]|nr:transposase [Chloroflexota bacterium]
MRFTETMVGRREAIVGLVREGLLSQVDAAAELGLSPRQVRRLVRRAEAAGEARGALAYQRWHPAPNRLAADRAGAARAVYEAHPRWSAQAIWEELEAGGQAPLPSLRTVSRWLGSWRGVAPDRRPKPARRFEAERPLDLVQMDTTSGLWLDGRRTAYVIVLLDDYSRAILAARAVEADSSWHNLRVLEEAVGRYGPPRVVYSDNGSVFRTTRHGGSRFFVYRPEVLAGEAPTQLARALGELGTTLLTHTLGNARAKGKLERWNRFFQERVLADGPVASVDALDAALQAWVGRYNERHHHRGIGGPPAGRLAGHVPRSLPAGARPLGDVCALLQTRKVARDHTLSLDGVSYTLPREPNLVAFTVELRVRPGQTVRVWHADRLAAEFPHGTPPPPDGLTVDDLLREILPHLEPKQPRAEGAPPRARSAARGAGRGGRTFWEGRR